jgi:cysteine desulfurase/selenocysteine lyase
MLNVEHLRADFPILNQEVKDHPLVYFDNAATTQKPQAVIDALVNYYQRDNANVHRGVHTLSQRATDYYEEARRVVQRFIHAPTDSSVLFTRGTTEAMNLVAFSWGMQHVQPGDRIVATQMEHHSNLVPWQRLAAAKGAEIVLIPVTEEGLFDMAAAADLINGQTRLVAVTHMSNTLGTLNDIPALVALARQVGALMVVDGAQSVPHLPVDVQALDVDFYAFSGHKLVGPTGIGVLYGKPALLEAMEPYQGGGSMIKEVFDTYSTWGDLPYRFEAGTPHIEGAIGLAAAINYLQAIGMEAIWEHEQLLTTYALEQLKDIDGIRLYGPTDVTQRGGIVSFNIAGIHPQDIGAMLDEQGIAIRTGHHCCQPLMRRYGVPGTARASFYLYNTPAEVDRLVAGVKRVQRVFARAAGRAR